MRKFYLQDFSVAFLLLVAQLSYAQDKLLPVPVSSQSDLQSLAKDQPAATDQLSDLSCHGAIIRCCRKY
jgi:hypothetical protein